MSWRFLKEEASGDYAIVIDGWEKGIGTDPYSGLQRLSQVNLSVPGEVSVGYNLSNATITSGTLGVPIAKATQFSSGVATFYYMLTSASGAESLVFKSSSGAVTSTWASLPTSNTNTGGTVSNQGLAFWKGYLFKFRNASIDYLANGAGTWVSGWNPADGSTTASAVIAGSTSHFALIGTDDVLYFCNGRGVGSIIEVAGATFDPTNTATYTFAAQPTTSANALNIPVTDIAVSLAEQGTNLLVGGTLNIIYPWDRISPTFNYPIYIGDNYINKMVTVNTNVYIFPGQPVAGTGRGRVFVTNGSQADEFFKIPDYLGQVNTPYFTFTDAVYHRNNLLWGMVVGDNATGAAVTNPSLQIWAYDLESNALRSVSTASTSTPRLLVPGLGGGTIPGFAYIVAESSGSSNNVIEYSASTSGIGSSAVFSDKIPVGTFYQKRTFTQLEFKLRNPLQNGESLILSYTSDKDSNTIKTFNTVGMMSGVTPVNFQGVQWLTVEATLIGNSASGGVPLREIRIR